MKEESKTLTKGELQVMNILWEKRHATVAETVEAFAEPRPAYNTVLTFLRILEEKGFVGHRKESRLYVYHPVVQKGEYTRMYMKEVRDSLFDGSAKCRKGKPLSRRGAGAHRHAPKTQFIV